MGEAVMPRERSVVGIDADDGAIRNRLAQPGLVDKWRQEVVTATQIKPVRRARNLGQDARANACCEFTRPGASRVARRQYARSAQRR